MASRLTAYMTHSFFSSSDFVAPPDKNLPLSLSERTVSVKMSSNSVAFAEFSYKFLKSSNKLGTPLRSGFSTYVTMSFLNSSPALVNDKGKRFAAAQYCNFEPISS